MQADTLKGNPQPPSCGRWRLEREIGHGAYGVVYLAVSPDGEPAAVKVCRREDVGDERYERELRGAKLYRSIPPHEGLVRMRGLREADGCFYAVMDLADDEFGGSREAESGYRPKTLARVIESEKALPVKECIGLALSLAKGLVVLQRHHLLHRDIKPANVLYVKGRPVLSDPGLLVEESVAVSAVGTPGYVPPEKFTDAASDVYSLGLTLMAASFGRQIEDLDKGPAMEADTGAKYFPAWWRILNKATDPTPSRRYQSAKALLKELEGLRRKMKFASIVESVIAKVALVLVLLGVAAVLVANVVAGRRAEDEIARRDAENKALKDGLSRQSEENRSLKDDLARQSKESQALRNDFIKQLDENKTLRADLARQSEVSKALKEDLSRQSEESQALRDDFIKQQDENKTLRADLAKQSEMSKALKDDLVKQSEVSKALKDDLSRQSEESQALRDDILVQLAGNKTLRADLAKQSEENKKLNYNLARQVAEIKALKQDVAKRPVDSKALTDKEVESLKKFQTELDAAKKSAEIAAVWNSAGMRFGNYDGVVKSMIDYWSVSQLTYVGNNPSLIAAQKEFSEIANKSSEHASRFRELKKKAEEKSRIGLDITEETEAVKAIAADEDALKKRVLEIMRSIYGKDWQPSPVEKHNFGL